LQRRWIEPSALGYPFDAGLVQTQRRFEKGADIKTMHGGAGYRPPSGILLEVFQQSPYPMPHRQPVKAELRPRQEGGGAGTLWAQLYPVSRPPRAGHLAQRRL
jgi:hypothetical protein